MIGVEKGSEKGSVRVTYNVTNPRVFGQQREQNVKPDAILTMEHPSLIVTRDLFNVTVPRRISLVHTKVLVVSEEFARSQPLIKTIESLIRERQFRRDIILLTARGSAETFIRQTNAVLAKSNYKYFELITQTGETTGYTPKAQLHEFLESSEEAGEIAVTVYSGLRESTDLRKSRATDHIVAGEFVTEYDNPAQMLGTALYLGNRMVGKLDGNETMLMRLLRGDMKRFHQMFNDPYQKGKRFACSIHQQEQPQVEVDMNRLPYKVNIRVPLDADLDAIQAGENYAQSLHAIHVLEQQMNKQFNSGAAKLIQQAQQVYKGDFFNIVHHAKRQVISDAEWKRKRWAEQFQHAEITVSFDTKLRRTGKQLGPFTPQE